MICVTLLNSSQKLSNQEFLKFLTFTRNGGLYVIPLAVGKEKKKNLKDELSP